MMRLVSFFVWLTWTCIPAQAQPVFVLDDDGAFGVPLVSQPRDTETGMPEHLPSREVTAPPETRSVRAVEAPTVEQQGVEVPGETLREVEGVPLEQEVVVPLPPADPIPPTEAEEIQPGTVFHIGGTHFATGSHELSASAWAGLRRIADALARMPERTIRIEGHTDDRGEHAMNQILSEDRAGSVADALASLGIERERMVVEGFGETRPERSNATPDGRAYNRRVDVVFE